MKPASAREVTVYTDGSCLGNPGTGGWAALLCYGDRHKELSGSEAATTNNRMELMAAIRALECLKRSCRVQLSTDSQYLRKGICEWLPSWRARGWRRGNGKPVLNADLWQRLEEVARQHDVEWLWVKGHSGHRENERVDQLAFQAARKLQLQLEGDT